MSKTIKTTPVSIYANTGFAFARAEVSALDALKQIAEKDVETARGLFIDGYVAARLFPQADALTAKMVDDARALVDRKGFKADAAKDEAKARRSQDQETIYGNARRAWSRLAHAAGIVQTEKRGGARTEAGAASKAKAEAKPAAGSGIKVEKTISKPADLVKAVHTFKGAWAALMVASKPLSLPAQVSDLALQITKLVNQLEGELAKVSK